VTGGEEYRHAFERSYTEITALQVRLGTNRANGGAHKAAASDDIPF
jgi:hypothetical protein